jgi:hypothetical protein
MRLYLISLLFTLFPSFLSGQVFTDSNLPVFVITTDGGASIPDEPGILGNLKVIFRGPGQRNYLTDVNNPQYLNYDGRIDIEIRGSSSQESPKKNYGFTTLNADNVTKNNVSLLGMPEENDWILGGMVFDTALIRDYLCFNLSRQIGEYASRTSYCEVVINNDYKGLYILQEKIKADDNRVDVTKITASDNTLPDITGGYIVKADKTTGGDPIAWTMYSWFGAPVDYILELPKPENATFYQTSYIKNEFTKLETTAMNGDASVINGYPSVIDIPSFIDFMIINEFACNADAYTYSTFFHKDRNGKLRSGPIWDLDLTFGNDLFMWGFDRSKPDVWFFQDWQNDGSRFWRDLFYNSQFRCYLAKRWNELIAPGQPLNHDVISSFIDATADSISEAVAREYQRWGKTGSFIQRISAIKSFIAIRMSWMTVSLGSYSPCMNVSVPELVITKIMYHPKPTALYPDDDDLEFIEIRNAGTATVNLSGICFAGTGLVYQFPANSTLGAGSCVIIASNSTAFKATYGFTPFGQFTRHLSNNSENIVLTDAFGNVIDYVLYDDTAPWPLADGNGYYLRLKDMGLDNSLASSWEASNDIITSVIVPDSEPALLVYPNPVSDVLNIKAGTEIFNVSIYDISGRLIVSKACAGERCSVSVQNLSKGIYILQVSTIDGNFTEKIVKY